ncbi:MAG: Blue-light-activated protein [Syntrophorhabdaceae bacterium PtaU1.Bin034]|nr:MAG: Blue-light-activated protein [Syntrophorhabdaceae bacterium PtaU1.Bin034]
MKESRDKMLFLLALAVSVGVLVLDLIAPLGASIWILYALPLLFDHRRTRYAYFTVAICSIFMLVGFYYSNPGIPRQEQLLTRITGIGVGWILAIVLTQRNQAAEKLRKERLGLKREVEERTAALAASEERYKALFENSLDGIFLSDPTQARILSANPAACRLFDFTEANLPLARDTTVDTNDPNLSGFLEERKQKGKSFAELMHRRLNGSMFSGEVSSVIYRDREGQTRAVNVIRDTTERRQAEAALRKAHDELEARVQERTQDLLAANQALRASEDLYRTIFDTTGSATIIIEDDMTISLVNDEFERLLKYRKAEIEGRMKVGELVVPEDLQKIEEYHRMRRINPHDAPRNYTAHCVRADGEVREVHVAANIISGTRRSVASITDITEQRTAEELLRESEERYRIAIEHSNDGVSLIRGGKHVFVNQKLLHMFGHERDEDLLDKTILITVHPDDRERVSTINAARQDGAEVPARYEFRGVKKDGTSVDVEVSATRVSYRGEPFALAYLRDITERKQAENARRKIESELRESEKRFRDLAELLPEVVFEADLTGRMTYLNQQALETFGDSREDFERGVNVVEKVAPEDRDRARANIERIVRGEKSMGNEYSGVKKDGTLFPILVHATPVSDAGRVLGIRGIVVDMSERRRVEQQVTRLATAVEGLAEGVAMMSPEGVIEYANPSACRLIGYRHEEFVGQNIRSVGILERKKLDLICRSLREGRSWSGTTECRKKDGGNLTVELAMSPVKDTLGATIGYIAVERDVTEELKLEMQLRQAQKMEAIGTLAGGIAHDFNNLLAIIIGNTELAVDDIPPDSDLQKNLDQILKASKRGRDLVKQILTFSRKTARERKAVRLIPVVEETFRLLRSSLPTSIQMVSNLEAMTDVIAADATQIQQILMNLATNAAYAMRNEGGTLTVGLEEITFPPHVPLPDGEMRPGRYVKLTLSDTGTGMDEEVKKRIFDPFFTTKQAGQGTGMGLAVVYGIVKSHNGAITLDSEPGKGSTFNLFFPCIDGAGENRAVEDSGAAPSGRERILFVDDEEAVTEIATEMLSRLGYSVTARQNPSDALQEFTQTPDGFDLVITDQSMPQMTGVRLAEEMIKVRKDVPIILCTGYSEVVSPEKAKDIGIREFVMKPLLRKEMAETIRRVLKAKRG